MRAHAPGCATQARLPTYELLQHISCYNISEIIRTHLAVPLSGVSPSAEATSLVALHQSDFRHHNTLVLITVIITITH